VEPQIQYATTKDGVSIAYYAIGQGPAVLSLMLPFSHLEAEWQIDSLRTTYIASAQRTTFIRLDHRGFGLSDRDVKDFAVDRLVLDIEAVVEQLGIAELRVYSLGFASIPALAYTARHPDVVTRFIQGSPAVRYEDTTNERLEKLFELADIDWDLAGETIMRSYNPDAPEDLIREIASLVTASVDSETFWRFYADMRKWNVEKDAQRVATPTLLIHRRNQNFSTDVTRRVASLIKNSRVAFVDNDFQGAQLAATFFFGGDSAARIDPSSSRREPAGAQTSAFRTILFTDLVDHAQMMTRLGDEKGREVLREHERVTREALRAHSGSEVKTMGDGFMASFGSATKALECAIAIQRAFADEANTVGAHHDAPPRLEHAIRVRCGLNAGEPIAEDDPGGRSDLFGTAVILAARIAGLAGAGEILVSDVIRQLLSGKNFMFADRGEHALKGFEDPVRVFEVRWNDSTE
jgi:class 3 adenylate cyclase/pimeloyl-ACP methyl ester carboxylesterase